MDTPQPEEYLIAEWQEPAADVRNLADTTRLAVIIGAAIGCVGFLALGIWSKDVSYYVGAIALPIGAFSLLSQPKKLTEQRSIALSSQQLIVGKKSYPLTDIAGFWHENYGENLVINVEMKKPTLLPITFFFSSNSLEEARHTLTQVIPEVEARQKELGDNINRYFRL